MHRRDAVLRVDLSSGSVSRERVPEEWRHRYLGGKGLGARYLYAELDAGVDPRSPENVLGFMLGPLSGFLPGETRYAAVTKSPLTGAFVDSYAGGTFPATLAGALPGCLGVLVTGEADDPVVLDIEDGDAHIRETDHWGKDTVDTAEAFDAPVACIGPAGEHRVAYATVASDAGEHHAGRGGVGAVMGSKRLKAVVARGDPPDLPPELADRHERTVADYDDHATGRWQAASETLESVDFADAVGALATEGWRAGRFDAVEDVGIEAARAAAIEREHPDEAIEGGFRVDTGAGEHVPRGAVGMSLGAGLGIEEFDAVATLGATCDRLGIDVIDGGTAVAWAALAAEKGLVDADVAFGDPEAARSFIDRIARREGPLPDALADGVDAAAERFGGDGLVPTVKAMALPGYDPRGVPGMALAYATSDRGGCHRRARPVEEEPFVDLAPRETVARVADAQTVRSVLWSLVADDFLGEVLRHDLGASWLAPLGFDHDADSLGLAGERIWTLVRLFNAREGFDREQDELPPRLRDPRRDGAAVDPATFETMLAAYYERRGWGADGLPTGETVERLGLSQTLDSETPLTADD